MNHNPRRALLTTIALLLGVIAGLLAAMLTYVDSGGIAPAIQDGGVAFAGATTLVLLILHHLEAL